MRISLLLLFVSAPAWAILVGAQSSRPGLESDCRILSYNQQGGLESICSGSLRSNREVVTAGHCVSDAQSKTIRFQIECGPNPPANPASAPQYATTSSGGRVLLNGNTFRERLEGQSVRIASGYAESNTSTDFAVIQLKSPAKKVRPLALATAEDHDRFFMTTPQGNVSLCSLRPGVECRVAGFGVTETGHAGAFNAGNVSCEAEQGQVMMRALALMRGLSPEQLTSIGSCLSGGNRSAISSFIRDALAPVQSMLPEGVIQPGDSGGALYCREMSGGTWRQVAVASGITLQDAPDDNGLSMMVMMQLWVRPKPEQLIPLSQWTGP